MWSCALEISIVRVLLSSNIMDTVRRNSKSRSQPETMNAVSTSEVAQGRIFWLPSKEELPERAIRRAHGKGAVDEGIYNHPVVVVSRPEQDSDIVHFQVVSSNVPRDVPPLTSPGHFITGQNLRSIIRQG
jgi:hypothetical protein